MSAGFPPQRPPTPTRRPSGSQYESGGAGLGQQRSLDDLHLRPYGTGYASSPQASYFDPTMTTLPPLNLPPISTSYGASPPSPSRLYSPSSYGPPMHPSFNAYGSYPSPSTNYYTNPDSFSHSVGGIQSGLGYGSLGGTGGQSYSSPYLSHAGASGLASLPSQIGPSNRRGLQRRMSLSTMMARPAPYAADLGSPGRKGKGREPGRANRTKPVPDKCAVCGCTSTPEWRRGPSGIRSLCNSCGLVYAKIKQQRDNAGMPQPSTIPEIIRDLKRIGTERFKVQDFALPEGTNERILRTLQLTEDANATRNRARTQEKAAAASLIGMRRSSVSDGLSGLLSPASPLGDPLSPLDLSSPFSNQPPSPGLGLAMDPLLSTSNLLPPIRGRRLSGNLPLGGGLGPRAFSGLDGLSSTPPGRAPSPFRGGLPPLGGGLTPLGGGSGRGLGPPRRRPSLDLHLEGLGSLGPLNPALQPLPSAGGISRGLGLMGLDMPPTPGPSAGGSRMSISSLLADPVPNWSPPMSSTRARTPTPPPSGSNSA